MLYVVTATGLSSSDAYLLMTYCQEAAVKYSSEWDLRDGGSQNVAVGPMTYGDMAAVKTIVSKYPYTVMEVIEYGY